MPPASSPSLAESTPAQTATAPKQPVPAQEDSPCPCPETGNRPAADFNGDGHRDLAVFKQESSGLVQVLYGSADGFHADASQQWAPNQLAAGDSETFGFTLTSGDFDGDRYSDLAIGDFLNSPEGDVGGQVLVLYGSAQGLSADRVQHWSQHSPGLDESPEADDWFGRSLAAGNLGYGAEDDLAIGVPGADGSGAVQLLFGGTRGLSTDGKQRWSAASAGVTGQPRRGDRFGQAIAVGDFDGGGYDELVVGAPGDFEQGTDGAVYILRGTNKGLTAERAQFWSPGMAGIKGEPSVGFGDSLTVGRFRDGGFLDLVIGNPQQSIEDTGSAGAVHVLYGSGQGLTAAGNQLWSEFTLGLRKPCDCDAPSDHPQFSASLIAADFGHSPADDLVVGVPGALTPGNDSGAITVMYGSPIGLTNTNVQQLSEATPGVRGDDPDEARFGTSLALAGPFPGTRTRRYPALVVGAPGYNGRVDESVGHGLLHILHGSARGLSTAGDWVLRAEQFPQRPLGQEFGSSMTS